MNAFRRETGQVAVLSVVFLTAIGGMTALVLDVGSWYRADRAAQATADAAALAGAQALPHDHGQAIALALDYADKNGGGLEGGGISFPATDTIRVSLTRPAPGFFAKLFGVDSVTVGAIAAAKAQAVGEAKYVAPIAVDEKHPLLQCPGGPCFEQATELPLVDLHKSGSGNAAGSFGLVNLQQGGSGHPGASTLGGWIVSGFDEFMPLGDYNAATGTEFNSSHVQDALKIRFGDELLFPVYRKIIGSGQNAKFEVIGWVGFVVTSTQLSGSKGKLFGHFTRFIAQGLPATGGGPPAFGTTTVTLVE